MSTPSIVSGLDQNTLNLLLAGISGIGSGLQAAGGTKTGQTSTLTPNFSPLQQTLANSILTAGNSILGSTPDLSSYLTGALKTNQTQGRQNINSLRSTLAARGLSNSPLASAEENSVNVNTGNQNSTISNQIPLLQRQLQMQALQSAGGAFGSIPTGTTSTGSGTQSASPLGALGSGLEGAGSIIALLNTLKVLQNLKSGGGLGTGTGGGLQLPGSGDDFPGISIGLGGNNPGGNGATPPIISSNMFPNPFLDLNGKGGFGGGYPGLGGYGGGEFSDPFDSPYFSLGGNAQSSQLVNYLRRNAGGNNG